MNEYSYLYINLAKAHHTDKYEHGYMEHYAEYLPPSCRSLLEIGVAKGGSALMWQQIYGPDCDIHILDLFQDPNHVSVPWCRTHNLVPHQGDQSDVRFLYTIPNMFDVIIEDGSHNSEHQIISFKHLFINNLKRGGVWATEDLHCCTDPFYWGTMQIKSVDDTILGLAKKFIETGEIISPFFNEMEVMAFKNNIAEMKLVCNDKLLFVIKK